MSGHYIKYRVRIPGTDEYEEKVKWQDDNETVNTTILLAIDELKQKLTDTDYIIIKIAEGVSTLNEYADTIALRQQWREQINKLEAQI